MTPEKEGPKDSSRDQFTLCLVILRFLFYDAILMAIAFASPPLAAFFVCEIIPGSPGLPKALSWWTIGGGCSMSNENQGYVFWSLVGVLAFIAILNEIMAIVAMIRVRQMESKFWRADVVLKEASTVILIQNVTFFGGSAVAASLGFAGVGIIFPALHQLLALFVVPLLVSYNVQLVLPNGPSLNTVLSEFMGSPMARILALLAAFDDATDFAVAMTLAPSSAVGAAYWTFSIAALVHHSIQNACHTAEIGLSVRAAENRLQEATRIVPVTSATTQSGSPHDQSSQPPSTKKMKLEDAVTLVQRWLGFKLSGHIFCEVPLVILDLLLVFTGRASVTSIGNSAIVNIVGFIIKILSSVSHGAAIGWIMRDIRVAAAITGKPWWQFW